LKLLLKKHKQNCCQVGEMHLLIANL